MEAEARTRHGRRRKQQECCGKLRRGRASARQHVQGCARAPALRRFDGRCAVALPAAAVTGSTGGAVLFEAVTLPAGGTSQAQVAGSGWAAEDASGAPLGAALALPCNQSPELPRWGKS